MVKIHIEHFFPDITPHQFWSLLLNPAFDAQLEGALGVKVRKELERVEDEKTIRRKARVVPGFPVPMIVQKAFGNKELEYLEESTYHRDQQTLEWKSQPNLFPDRVLAKGGVTVKVEGNGVRRVISGDITVNLPGLGGLIEKLVKESVERSYEKASELTRQWIRDGRVKTLPLV